MDLNLPGRSDKSCCRQRYTESSDTFESKAQNSREAMNTCLLGFLGNVTHSALRGQEERGRDWPLLCSYTNAIGPLDHQLSNTEDKWLFEDLTPNPAQSLLYQRTTINTICHLSFLLPRGHHKCMCANKQGFTPVEGTKTYWALELCYISFSSYNNLVIYCYLHRGTKKLSDLLKAAYLLSLGVKDWVVYFPRLMHIKWTTGQ